MTLHTEDEATVAVQLNAERLLVKARREIFPIYGNCRDMDDEPKDKPRWVARLAGT